MFCSMDAMEPIGKLKIANRIANRNRIPKMVPVLFVGMSCFGNALPMISDIVSLPTYL